jgi:hypothetical protein
VRQKAYSLEKVKISSNFSDFWQQQLSGIFVAALKIDAIP